MPNQLKHQMSAAEKLLWAKLHEGRLEQYQFIWQHTLADYVVNFCSIRLLVIVELVEDPEAEKEKNNTRDEKLEDMDFIILYFSNTEVLADYKPVTKTIESFI